MFYIAWILTLGVAALHGWFLWLEMIEWEKPRTMRIFGTTPAFAAESKALAGNMGLYNGFLAVGLMLGLINASAGRDMVYYLLACVLVAGVYGGVTVSFRVMLVQALPAAVALLAWWAA
jgi:putative membrane protein